MNDFTIQSIYLEITNRCNLNCATCYNRSRRNRETKELSCAEIERCIAVFRPYGLQRVALSGGEPTLHSDFNRILALPEQYPDLRFGIVTNATHNHQGLISAVNDGLFDLQISLDGSCEEVNARTRGAGYFAPVIRFAKQIHRQDAVLKMVVSQNNFEDVEDFCELALSLGFQPDYAAIFRSGNGGEDWDSKGLSDTQRIQLSKRIAALNEKYNLHITVPSHLDGCPYTGKMRDLSLAITTDGFILPCQTLYRREYALGDIREWDTIQFERNIQAFADLCKKRLSLDFGCGRCILKDRCFKGCVASTLMCGNDPLGWDGNCTLRKMEFLDRLKKGVRA